MGKKVVLPAIALIVLVLAGCGGRRDDGILRTDESHTFEGYPVVYISPDVSAKGLLAAYEALEVSPGGNTAIKLSDTETDDHFQWTELIQDLSQSLEEATIVENNSAIDFSDFDHTIVASHFRNHDNVGFNGAVKQTAMLSAFPADGSCLSNIQNPLMTLAEMGKYAADNLSGPILYISVMDRLSIESGSGPLPDSNTYNIGILSSYDPVALDQACVDFVYMVREGAPFAAHIAAKNGIYTLSYAEEIGLGSRTYALTVIDD